MCLYDQAQLGLIWYDFGTILKQTEAGLRGGITERMVQGLRPRGRMYEVTCRRLSGFTVRVLPTGRKVFFVRYQDDGRDRRRRLGQWGESYSVDEARRQAMAILFGDGEDAPVDRAPAFAAGRTTASPKTRRRRGRARVVEQVSPARAQSHTVRVLAERFEREFISVYLKPGSAANYRRNLRDHILPVFGDRHFLEVSRSEVKALHGRLCERPGLADYVLCVIGSLYTRIIEDWELSDMRNPTAGIKRFGSRRVERFLSPEERRAVDDVLERRKKVHHGHQGYIEPFSVWGIKLLMLTGLRRNEVLTLTWPMVDWQHSCFHLPDTKTGQRTVVVSNEVIRLLREIHDATGNPRQGVVVRGRRGTKLSSLNVTWSAIREEAGIPDVRLHDLRHSFASDALMAGVPLAIVGEMLGHKQARTTMRYAHLANSVVRDALETTTSRILSATEGSVGAGQGVAPFVPMSDAQWSRVAQIIGADRPRGGSPVDLRNVVDGVRWKLERSARWSDIPSYLGTRTTCTRWYKRWVASGAWKSVVAVLNT